MARELSAWRAAHPSPNLTEKKFMQVMPGDDAAVPSRVLKYPDLRRLNSTANKLVQMKPEGDRVASGVVQNCRNVLIPTERFRRVRRQIILRTGCQFTAEVRLPRGIFENAAI